MSEQLIDPKPHPRGNDGFRACRRTGPPRDPRERGQDADKRCDWVTVYDAVAQGIETDPATPWAVVCEQHATCVCIETRRAAEEVMRSGSLEFCDECRELAKPPAEPQEQAARWRKIARMFAAALAHRVEADTFPVMTAPQWRIVALAAGVPEPSETTVRLALRTLREVTPPKDDTE